MLNLCEWQTKLQNYWWCEFRCILMRSMHRLLFTDWQRLLAEIIMQSIPYNLTFWKQQNPLGQEIAEDVHGQVSSGTSHYERSLTIDNCCLTSVTNGKPVKS